MSGLVRTRCKGFSFSSYHRRNDFSRQSVILWWICAGWVCICWAAVQRRMAEGLTEPVWSLLKTESERRPPNPHLHRRQRDEERWRKVVQTLRKNQRDRQESQARNILYSSRQMQTWQTQTWTLDQRISGAHTQSGNKSQHTRGWKSFL